MSWSQIPGDYLLTVEVIQVCGNKDFDEGSGEDYRWRFWSKNNQEPDYSGGWITGVNEVNAGNCFNLDVNTHLGEKLPIKIYNRIHNISSGNQYPIYLKAQAFEKDCFVDNSHNGDDLNYKAACYCGPFGSIRCSNKDDDGFRETSNLILPINLNSVKPGQYSLYHTYKIEVDGDDAYEFTVVYKWTPPIPETPIISGNGTTCSGDSYTISTNLVDTLDLTYVWYENIDFKVINRCDEMDQECLNLKIKNCLNCNPDFEICTDCECSECVSISTDPMNCSHQCRDCLICIEEYDWTQIATTQSPKLNIEATYSGSTFTQKQYKVEVSGYSNTKALNESKAGGLCYIYPSPPDLSDPPTEESTILNTTKVKESQAEWEITHVACRGENTGEIKIISVGNHSIPLNFRLYSDLEIASKLNVIDVTNINPVIFSNLSAGLYKLRVINNWEGAEYCFREYSIGIKEPETNISLSFSNPNTTLRNGYFVSCQGKSDGSVELSASGGIPGYSFNLGGSTNHSGVFQDLPSGSILATALDTLGCNQSISVIVTEPSEISFIVDPKALKISSDYEFNISCNGGNDGQIFLELTGGVPDYQVSLLDSVDQVISTQTGSDQFIFNELTAGKFSFEIKDQNNCIISASQIILTQPSPIKLESIEIMHPACPGGDNGSITSIISGGIGGYSSTLNNKTIISDSLNFQQLMSGKYELSVTDLWGCEFKKELTVPENPEPLEIQIADIYPVRCWGNKDGQIDLTISGGSKPYTYELLPESWRHDSIYTNHISIKNLSGGNSHEYTLKVMDSNFEQFGQICSQTIRFLIPQPDTLSAQISLNEPTCYGNQNGTIDIHPYGGTGNYELTFGTTFNTIQSNQSASFEHLLAGEYSYSLTDSKNCPPFSEHIYLGQPRPLSIKDLKIIPTYCDKDSSGIVSIQAEGGQGSIQYKLDSKINLSGIFRGLKTGEYHIIMEDENNCGILETILIPQITPQIEVKTTAISCVGKTDGKIEVEVKDYGDELFFSINGLAFQSSPVFNNLSPGLYNITVKNSRNCQVTMADQEITSPIPFEVNKYIDYLPTCGQNTGKITFEISGGSPPYVEELTDYYGNLHDSNQLRSGTYRYKIIDSNGCIFIEDIILEEQQEPIIKHEVVSNPTCGRFDGIVKITVVGIENPEIESNANLILDSLNSGNHDVNILDAESGCVFRYQFILQENDPMKLNWQITNSQCGSSVGEIELHLSGGIPPFFVLWNELEDEDSFHIKGLGQGIYTGTVMDESGCTENFSIAVKNENGPQIISYTISKTLCNSSTGQVFAKVSGGLPPYQFKWNRNIDLYDSSHFTFLSEGEHLLEVIDQNGCIDYKVIRMKVDESSLPTFKSFNLSPSHCGNPDGAIDFEIIGGNPPYLIELNESKVENNYMTGLSPGNYELVISDTNDCKQIKNFEIGESDYPVIKLIEKRNISCEYPEGFVAIEPGWGNQIESVYWNGILSDKLFHSPGKTGFHEVFTIDKWGCLSNVIGYNIYEEKEWNIELINLIKPSCIGAADGELTIGINGEADSVTFHWNQLPEQSGPTIRNLSEGLYEVTVINSSGCKITKEFEITDREPIEIDQLIINSPSCFEAADGYIEVIPKGGLAPYEYFWNNLPGRNILAKVVSGSYPLKIIDKKGCEYDTLITVPDFQTDFYDLIPDTLKVCPGQKVFFDAGEYEYPIWTLNDSLQKEGNIFHETVFGKLNLQVETTSGCKLVDSTIVETDNNFLEADLIAPTTVISGDTIIAIDISWPEPDEIHWTLPEPAITLTSTKFTQAFIIHEPGIYKVGMSARLGTCTSAKQKFISVAKNETESNSRIQQSGIRSFILFPNPSNQYLNIKVELFKEDQIDIQLLDIGMGKRFFHQSMENEISVEKKLDISHIPIGMYILVITTSSEQISKRFFKL